MKSIIKVALVLFAFPAFAIDLAPEAQCRGEENGKEIIVTSYVNTQKFCVNVRRDMKSVIQVQDSNPFGSVYTAVATETTNTIKHKSDAVELILKPNSESAEFVRNGVKTEMSCFFIQYQLDC